MLFELTLFLFGIYYLLDYIDPFHKISNKSKPQVEEFVPFLGSTGANL
jgi:hypothetical protein